MLYLHCTNIGEMFKASCILFNECLILECVIGLIKKKTYDYSTLIINTIS